MAHHQMIQKQEDRIPYAISLPVYGKEIGIFPAINWHSAMHWRNQSLANKKSETGAQPDSFIS